MMTMPGLIESIRKLEPRYARLKIFIVKQWKRKGKSTETEDSLPRS